jgi:ribosomal protein S18 acetylase RimI-like enzyme
MNGEPNSFGSSPAARIELITSLSPELKEAVLSELRAFNQAANPEWYVLRELPENQPVPVNLVAFDSASQVLGGLLGETHFHWLKISILAVRAEMRGQGLGTRLMDQAESIGRERGCRHAFLDTMEYQAPIFYERLGYQTAGRIDDWDSHGHAKFFMTKELAE